MYNLKRNNYLKNTKPSNIQTPLEVSEFIFELLSPHFPKEGKTIFDPCCGKRNLLEPWREAGYQTEGIDIDPNAAGLEIDFLTMKKEKVIKEFIPQLILCNPPFNGYGKKLGSEVWLDKIIELFGEETNVASLSNRERELETNVAGLLPSKRTCKIPIVLFAPVGFCANLTLKSKRLEKFENGTYPPIASRITLPKNIFEGAVFHSEILIFNIEGLEGHYFYKPNE